MPSGISMAVGAWAKGAVNKPADVIYVQQLLVKAAATLKNKAYDPGTPDGLVARPPNRSATVAAIRSFQLRFMRNPDGLVEPRKRTIQELEAIAGVPAPTPSPPTPSPKPAPLPAGIDLAFSGDTIALIVRGKISAAHDPGVMEQHADCALSDGSPVGFFGTNNGGSANDSGMGLTGVVADYNWFRAHRPSYVDQSAAKKYSLASTILLVRVGATQARLFDAYWKRLAANPGNFYILGDNCSTHASDAFVSSGILGGGIPGIDTPNNLYNQLVALKGGAAKSYSGYVGFAPKAGGFVVNVNT